MRPAAALAWSAWLLAIPAAGQALPSVRVYSELQRIDPFGKIVASDQPKRSNVKPREILSPAVVRNGHLAFHVALTVPEGAPFTLHVGQNPEDFFAITVYRENHARRGGQWVPDELERLELPYSGSLPDNTRPIPGQTTMVFLADLRTSFDTPARRSRVEFQLFMRGGWTIYPLEVRVMPVIVPAEIPVNVPLAGPDAPSDAALRTALLATVCGAAAGEGAQAAPSRSVLGILARNASADAALLRLIADYHGRPTVDSMLSLAGVKAEGFCEKPRFPDDLGPEWYLKFRDALYRMVN